MNRLERYPKVNKYTNRCSTSLLIREIRTMITMRYCYIPASDYNLKRLIMSSVGEDAAKLELSYTAGGNAKWYRRFGKQSNSFLRS